MLMRDMGKRKRQRYLTLDELSPTVHGASCFRHAERAWHRYRLIWHHLILVEAGRIRARTPQGEVEAEAGDLLCFRPTELNEYGNLTPIRYFQAAVAFAPPPRHQCTPMLDECGPLPVKLSLGKAFDDMRREFETICLEITQAGASHRLRLRAAVHEVLAVATAAMKPDRASHRHLDAWQRMRLSMDAAPQAEIRVAQLARQMQLSPDYFIRAFRRRFGVPPKAYHPAARLRPAVPLLRSTEQPVKATAYEMGFTDAKAFTRLFHRHFGIRPSDVRAGKAHHDAVASTDGLLPVNTHLLPPGTDIASWMELSQPRQPRPRRR
jgi:AraC-like DNA-binding protein